jgi:predicted DNA repair protein MutK
VATGLIALLDDVAAIAKMAAASLDDVAAAAGKAGVKAAGVVIDDAAVTPRYVVGFAAARELPIIRRIALGSLRNKLLILLPAALALSAFAPWAITPLLMLGGAYLCYEGAEKVYGAIFPHAAHAHEEAVGIARADPMAMEDAKVKAAIGTDFILSAEIMAIALATIPDSSLAMQAVILAVVGIGITAAVYGAVALIVKADDVGVALALSPRAAIAGFGRGLVRAMPPLLTGLTIIGTAAMVWVGGGIIIHGLEVMGFAAPAHALEALAHPVAASPILAWLAIAAGAGVAGLVLGGLLIPVVQHVIAPLVARLRGTAKA